MSWADEHIKKLRKGETVSFRPRGRSMEPRIKSGQLCTVAPVEWKDVRVDDVVLCTVNHRHFLHLVKEVDDAKIPGCVIGLTIGNNKGGINGKAENLFGRLVKVED